jgi:hypothetical protein
MKFIREARMGRPKSFKTGAVVGTYPKPLLYLGFDRGGLDVIPTKDAKSGAKDIKMDLTYEDISFVKPVNITNAIQLAVQPKVTALDFTAAMPMTFQLDTKPAASQDQLQAFQQAYNVVVANQAKLPYKTIVVDSLTGYTDACLAFIAAFNPAAMADARQWAGQAGGLVRKLALSITNMPCHVVMLLHSVVDKNDITNAITEQPSVYSQVLRDDFFGLFSQCFYAFKKDDGTPTLWVSDRYPVKGIGPRWPQGLAQEIAPDFTSIYGKET